MILAAAAKIHIKKTDKDVVLCGARHGNIFDQIEQLGLGPDDYEEVEDGFIDHTNRFLTRKEAFEHAKMCGQLSSKIIYLRENGQEAGGRNLISEDLY